MDEARRGQGRRGFGGLWFGGFCESRGFSWLTNGSLAGPRRLESDVPVLVVLLDMGGGGSRETWHSPLTEAVESWTKSSQSTRVVLPVTQCIAKSTERDLVLTCLSVRNVSVV